MEYYYSGEEMPTKKYYIRYGTGAGDEEVEGTLAEAMRKADEGAAYTQHNIEIYQRGSLHVAVRHWFGVSFDPNDEANRYITADDVIEIGDGYYDAWKVREDDEEADAMYECRYDWKTYTHEMY